MDYRTITHSLRRNLSVALAVAVLPFALPAQGSGPAGGEDVRAQITELQREFVELKTKLETVQQQAMQKDRVQETLDAVQSALKSAMLDEAPGQSESINEYFDLRDKLASINPQEASPQAQTWVEEFTALRQELTPVLEEASQNETVVEAREESRDAILAAMTNIEPNTPSLLEEQRALVDRYQQLQMRLQQGAGS